MVRFLLSLFAALCLALGPLQVQAAVPAQACCGMEDGGDCPCEPAPAPAAPCKALTAPAPAVRRAEAPAPVEAALSAPRVRPAFPRPPCMRRAGVRRPAPRAGPPRLRLAKLRTWRE